MKRKYTIKNPEARRGGKQKLTIEDCRKLALARKGQCLSLEYIDSNAKLEWVCENNHRWSTSLRIVKGSGSWCPKCSGVLKGSLEQCQRLAIERSGKCLSAAYINNYTKLEWECSKQHNWFSTPSHIKNNNTWCPICAKRSSKLEEELFRYVKLIYPETKHRVRKILKNPKYELDIYIPSLNKAIEYDGTYWHRNTQIKDADKDSQCREAGIQLLRIPEEDYKNDKLGVLNRVLRFIGPLAS